MVGMFAMASCSDPANPTVARSDLTPPTAPHGEPVPSATAPATFPVGASTPDPGHVADLAPAPPDDDAGSAVPDERVSRFPLRVIGGERALIDATGEPFLMLGDAAWSLIVELDRDEVDQYLANRRALGFNAVLVELIEHRFSSNPPYNRAGEAPFVVPGDFSTPNEDYFQHADWVLQRLADNGFLVLLTPAYTGWIGGSDGWWEEMVRAGPETLRAYGRYLGERYSHFDNIMWVQGGDGDPPQPELVAAIAEGISETDPDALHTAHLNPDTPPREFWAGSDWLDVDNVYTYDSVYDAAKVAFEHSMMPYFLMESTYENEHDVETRQLRTQVYHALLAGATGHIFGNNPIWHFDGGGLFGAPVTWQEALNGPGSQSMAAIATVMAGVSWSELVPDLDADLLTGGIGKDHDRAVASMADDTSWAMLYVPTGRTMTLDLMQLGAGNVRLTWLDASSGKATWETTVAATGPVDVQTPGDNAAGDEDWVLLVEGA